MAKKKKTKSKSKPRLPWAPGRSAAMPPRDLPPHVVAMARGLWDAVRGGESTQLIPAAEVLDSGRTMLWSPEEIDEFSTEEIFRRLKSFNIETSPEQFLEDVNQFLLAEDLAEAKWYTQPAYSGQDVDDDFPWMAAGVLWQRLAPDVPEGSQINRWIGEGYDLLEAGDRVGCCRIWLRAWDGIVKRFVTGRRSVEELQDVLRGLWKIDRYCVNLVAELARAGETDPEFLQERGRVCHQFIELLPDSDKSIIHSMTPVETPTK